MCAVLGGMAPFDGANEEQILDSVLHSKLSFKDETWDEISSSAKDMIKRSDLGAWMGQGLGFGAAQQAQLCRREVRQDSIQCQGRDQEVRVLGCKYLNFKPGRGQGLGQEDLGLEGLWL